MSVEDHGPVTNYRKGRRLEYKCIKYLKGLGYYCVRSAGSKGAADVVAFGVNDTLVIQVKAKGCAGADAITKLMDIPKLEGRTRQVWEYDRGKWIVYWSD